jgi:hypothetical protein
MDPLRLRYLEALGVQAWVSRNRSADAPRSATGPALRLGPGEGGCLFVCERAEQSGGRLAADVARACREQPVWSWPEADRGAPLIGEAVRERLFTAVIVFGEALAGELFGASVPDTLGSARVVVAPDLDTLAVDPGARRACWSALRRAGVTGAR